MQGHRDRSSSADVTSRLVIGFRLGGTCARAEAFNFNYESLLVFFQKLNLHGEPFRRWSCGENGSAADERRDFLLHQPHERKTLVAFESVTLANGGEP